MKCNSLNSLAPKVDCAPKCEPSCAPKVDCEPQCNNGRGGWGAGIAGAIVAFIIIAIIVAIVLYLWRPAFILNDLGEIDGWKLFVAAIIFALIIVILVAIFAALARSR